MNRKYIGGDLELDPRFSLEEKGPDRIPDQYSFYSCGRAALKTLLAERRVTGPVLLPSYLCDSVVQPFRELRIPYRYYTVDAQLRIDFDDLRNLLETNHFSAILCIDYFGHVNHQQYQMIRELNDRIIILQDCSHLSFIPDLLHLHPYHGDYVFGSLRKMMPVPDGGFILKKGGFSTDPPLYGFEEFYKKKYVSKILRHFFIQSDFREGTIERVYMELSGEGEALLDAEIGLFGMSGISQLNYAELFDKRRSNFRILSGLFENEDGIRRHARALIREMSPSDLPYSFPVCLKNMSREMLRNKLRENHVFSPVLWNLPDELQTGSWEGSLEISRTMIGLPVDHRYDTDDMKILFEVFGHCLKEVLDER
jgi:hypothetical protein